MRSLCITGHRPANFYNIYDISDPFYSELVKQMSLTIESYIVNFNVSVFYTGGALGIDTMGFFVIQKLKTKYPHIKNIICIPFGSFNNDDKWYKLSIQLADAIVDVSRQGFRYNSGGNHVAQLQLRNEYMVDNSDFVLAVYDGSRGGTYNCIKYAVKKLKTIKYIYIALEGQMQITFIDNIEHLNKQLFEGIKLCLRNKDSKAMSDYCDYLKKLVELQGQPTIQFDNSPLESELSKLAVKNIFENGMIEFETPQYDVLITLKNPKQLT